jgi:hypothetical protein
MRVLVTFSFLVFSITRACASNHPYFIVEREHIFRGHAGLYGFYEVSGRASQEMHISSVVIVADHELRLPFRVTHAAALGAISSLAVGALVLYRRRHANAA